MPPKLNTLTLKQRLAALSLSTSSPTSPASSSTLRFQNSRGPNFNSLPWLKNRSSSPSGGGGGGGGALYPFYQDEETIQTVLSKMIFQAGVDYETRPMVVVNASALPDPQLLNYDILLARILAYLNLYVESDYTLVFFAAGGRHTPSWNWLWKAYRSLSRKYRKNLKQLYIVHSSFFTKMLFSLAGAMISPKFFRKIIYVETLSELALYVPITQIDIPPAVYKENSKHEDRIVLPVPQRSTIFGVPLEELMGFYGEKGGIPRVVRDCIQYIRETALEEEGIFRRSAQSSLLKAAQEAYDRGNVVSLRTFEDPHIAAVLLKKFIRDLPEPIFPERLYPLIRQCPFPSSSASSDPNGDDVSSCIHYIRETLFPELAPCAYILLSQVLHLMHDVALRSSVNRMDAHNLAIVLCLNLVHGKDPVQDAKMFSISPPTLPPGLYSTDNTTQASDGHTTLGMIIKLCIQRYYEVFDDVRDPSEPLTSTIPTTDSEATVVSLYERTAVDASGDNTRVEEEAEEEDINDEMLIMPIGPSQDQNGSASVASGDKPAADANDAGGREVRKFRLKSKTTRPASPPVDVVEVASAGGATTRNGNGVPYATLSKARSVFGVDNNENKRRGSISIGSGKGVGSGVEALGVTAAGFFFTTRP